jgi:hypothetical protein
VAGGRGGFGESPARLGTADVEMEMGSVSEFFSYLDPLTNNILQMNREKFIFNVSNRPQLPRQSVPSYLSVGV